MSDLGISQEIRQRAELQCAEIIGRLHACAYLENGAETITDGRVLYGWNMLTQEVLIRAAEASLKLLYAMQFDKPSPRGHNLKELWERLPVSLRDQVETMRREFPGGQKGICFTEYDTDIFQDVRYSYERLFDGQTRKFEVRRLYFDTLAVVLLANQWLGDLSVWPWAGIVGSSLSGYRVLPTASGKFDVLIDSPIEPMDWAGAIIEPKGTKYVWTLYVGFEDNTLKKRSFEIPGLCYPWPIKELIHDSVVECVEQIHRAYQEPCPALLQAIQAAERSKRVGNTE